MVWGGRSLTSRSGPARARACREPLKIMVSAPFPMPCMGVLGLGCQAGCEQWLRRNPIQSLPAHPEMCTYAWGSPHAGTRTLQGPRSTPGPAPAPPGTRFGSPRGVGVRRWGWGHPRHWVGAGDAGAWASGVPRTAPAAQGKEQSSRPVRRISQPPPTKK